MAFSDSTAGATPRRFLVTADALNLCSGSYSSGDVLTEKHIGDRSDWLVSLGAIEEIDYDIGRLNEGPCERG